MDWKKTECKQIGNCLLSSLLSLKNLSVYLFVNGRKRNILLFLKIRHHDKWEKWFFCTNHSLPRKNEHTSIALTGCQSPSDCPYLKTSPWLEKRADGADTSVLYSGLLTNYKQYNYTRPLSPTHCKFTRWRKMARRLTSLTSVIALLHKHISCRNTRWHILARRHTNMTIPSLAFEVFLV